MAQRIWLLCLLLALPAVGFGVAAGVQSHFGSELRSAIHKQHPDLPAEKLNKLTISLACQRDRADLPEICSTNDGLVLMKHGALGVAAAGLLLLLLIKLLGLLTRGNRALLVLAFVPGLYLTTLALVGVILVHAAIAIGIIYYGTSVFFGIIPTGIMFGVGLGAALGVWAMARATLSVVRTSETYVIGTELSREEAPLLWSHVENLASKIGALQPQHIVVGLDPNFFVTEAKVVCLSGNISGRTLYCSLPLCRILSKNEMSAVVGHELGHYKGKDTKFSKRFYPVYRGTTEAIASLHAAGGEGIHAVALIPAITVLNYFLQCFSRAEHRLGRDRELAADKVGAGVAGPATMATALVKVHAFTAYWGTLQQAVVTALKQGNIFVNASKTYAEMCAQNARPSALQGIADSHTSHPTDTHPPLGARLKNLQTSLQEVSSAALDIPPSDCAVAYVTDYEAKEEEISESYQLLLAQTLGISLDAKPASATAAQGEGAQQRAAADRHPATRPADD